ncbi:SDR family NAD(P)-dependent oxidoreductase [Vibrio sinaloensis]|uniref:SDR family NAD(P)-dependent oxidoreductase n=1 Tax=Photobacterium sp. (strain ATCC 43367) TaxID=379097 RepID=UPI0035EAF491
MQKIILVTGATDGIGLETAKMLVAQDHHVIIHGRNPAKVANVEQTLLEMASGKVASIVADLSSLQAVREMIGEVSQRFGKLDVLINNAGVFSIPKATTVDGLDARFMVNTIAPYLLTKELLPLLSKDGRVVNLSSAAQARVDLDALVSHPVLSDGESYAQSKLALTMWSRMLGLQLKNLGPVMVSVNPKSFLGSKMVKEAYGVAGNDLSLGADILYRASVASEFANAHGAYYDNDIEAFANPHSDALDDAKCQQVIEAIEAWLNR